MPSDFQRRRAQRPQQSGGGLVGIEETTEGEGLLSKDAVYCKETAVALKPVLEDQKRP